MLAIFHVWEPWEGEWKIRRMDHITGHRVSLDRLEEFRRIYKESYGQEITTAQASEMTHRLLTLYRLLRQPLPVERAQRPPGQEPPAQTAPEAS